MVQQDANWKLEQLDFDRDSGAHHPGNSAPLMNATDPDLSKFTGARRQTDSVSWLGRPGCAAAQYHSLL